MKYIFFLILVLQHCYLNPVFRGILFSEQDEENLDILALAGGLGGSGNGINELGNTDGDSLQVPIEQVAPTILFSPSSYSFKNNFAIPAIRPTVTGTPLSDCIASDPLVIGLKLNPNNCRITGKPTANTEFGPLVVTITATNPWGSDSDTVSIEVIPALGNDSAENFSITVTGLQGGESFLLEDILGNEFLVSSNGSLDYDHPHLVGSQYLFTIIINPIGKTCTIENASGTVSDPNPPISINCG